ncbi:Sterile alpha motif domain-containing protein 3 [Oryzias melastigma]|uniref:Sterile alpha motif domain-containing protein 3 n=1 Tax=Oryzias melastigma TaxID=30732 RepID=A0A834C6Q5_ORYME|nr:Sterile alpha motif domain-containing protein 3 [Oryzias melastigma]
MDILDKIAQAVFDIKAYPDQDQIESVASALVTKHPCLQEPGSGTGYDGWKMSIKYKLGNYRSKLRQAGCNELSINRKRKSIEDVDTSPSLKKAKRGEINFVPDHPDNHNDDSMEEERLALLEESQKRSKDLVLIKEKMELTFSLRRKAIVEMEPMVTEVMERWPALFSEAEIRGEFHRITNKDLMDNFRAGLSQHTYRLLKLYRARRTAFPAEMGQLLNRHLTSHCIDKLLL